MVTCGLDTIETCDAATSVIVAPARSAIRRWVSGGITRSWVPTTAQLGSVFQAPTPEGVVLALNVIGRWLAAIRARSCSERSWAKELCTVSGFRNASASPSGASG